MCIRDRVYGYQFNWMARYSGPDNKLGRSYYKLISDTNPLAVSYTHLRAHETVLDLVCRLLLEKKKKI